MLNKNESDIIDIISPQTYVSFKQTKETIRDSNIKLYTEEKNDTSVSFEGATYIDNKELQSIYEKNMTSYSSQKIFLFREPLIEKVIKYYIENADFKTYDEDTNNSIDLKVIGTLDVKIFYLFSNVKQSFNCAHQYKLFDNTAVLMQMIDNSNVKYN